MRQLRRDYTEVGFRLPDRNTRLQTSRDPGIVGVSFVQPGVAFNLGLHHHGHPDLGPIEDFGAVERARRDSPYGIARNGSASMRS